MARSWPRRLIENTVLSLEKRLIGALCLIAACALASLVLSHQFGAQVREDNAALQVTAANAARAQQLENLVSDFRIASHEHLNAAETPVPADAHDLNRIAADIDAQVDALRQAGMPPHEIAGASMSFDDLDPHIQSIMQYQDSDSATVGERLAILGRNKEMANLAALIASDADREMDSRFAAIDHAARSWSLYVLLAGLLAIGLIILILADVMGNILPAMQRMYGSLRRLAAGELDVRVERFELRELRELAGPLEVFRRNALRVKNLAFTDSCTGLPNRRAMIDHVERRLKSGEDLHFAVIVADIDRFKHVNDDFGHAAGDRLVKLVGRKMQEMVGPDAMVARVGGDEFGLFVPIEAFEQVCTIVNDLVRAMREPIELGSYSIAITISAGAIEVNSSDNIHDINALLDRADLALYAAKNEGRNRAVSFTPELEAERELDRQLERDLVRAIENDELRMVYQPIHAVEGPVKEVEALVRWTHAKLGEISPIRFIAAAERSGTMVSLGAWIIERALSDLRAWPGVNLSLNLSPLQLQQDGFCPYLLSACCKYDILPQRIMLEVTESLSIERNNRALLTLDMLRNAGFRIALDDFGTGYSSLSMMKTFRFDRLKLDRSLINDLGEDPAAQAVFDAAVTMALRVGAQVVAEGISEGRLVNLVSRAGCTHLQGFHLSRPIEAEDVEGYYIRCEACADEASAA
ncbi:putative bifunctional diguanylate cyclase/phosphodiesterase [Aurantiacibacter poecillastricola]|uniref:putative bifunctional diguanylate cyclase/phosphodiesterase n=1 Tax=Aurantiacibacter poecillastricola TaxID=3064385 RepID=UPI00273D2047|nr:bifunctional diguanylate cyclase/phosphodiesterase [Aurantiacibacter sp. 219JJ12-13]MDP5261498.1 bifunctional diguanylate cyclase/phosphodiesterase [Aurantiacibacter sp. 219JJ12-13]